MGPMAQTDAMRGYPVTVPGAENGSEIVALRDVGYVYRNGTVALEGINLSIKRGEIVTIVGPSGCGKSTLLRIIAGLTDPTSGSVTKPEDTTEGRSPLTMVFQQDTLLPWLTAAQNVGLYSRFLPFRERGRERVERNSRVKELVDLVGLTPFANAYPYQLSGGMRRRLAFISAVAPLPTVLLLDEPFASVDEPTRIQIHQDILRIIHRLGMTVILVTHDLAEAASLSDRVMIMTRRPGRIMRLRTVPFGPEREMLDLRQSSQFLELYGALWHDLSQQLH